MNPSFIQRVAKLVPYPSKHSTVPALAFAYHFEPPADESLQVGSLFVVIEVMAKDSISSQVVDLIIKTIGEEYYNKKFHEEASVRFEKAVSQLNKQLGHLFASHHGSLIHDISAVIAVINGDELLLTQTGKAHARLYRNRKVTDLADGLNEGSSKQKLFHGIAEGSLKEKDKLLFATPALLFQFQSQTLDNMIQDHNPASCINTMSAQLSQEETKSRCAAMVVELTSPEQAAEEPLMHEPDTVFLGKAQTKVDEAKAAALPHAQKVTMKTKAQLSKAQHWATASAWPEFKQRVKSTWNTLWTRYIDPNPRKAFLVVVGLLVAIVLGVLFISNNNVNYRTLTANYKSAIALTDTAEAKQQLGDKAAAEKALADAKSQLRSITSTYNQYQIQRAIKQDSSLASQKNISPKELEARLSAIDDKLQNITRIDPSVVVDFTSKSNFTAKVVTQLDDRLYVVDTGNGILYQIDPSKKAATIVAQSSSLKTVLSATPSSLGGSIYLLTSRPSVLEYRLGAGLSEVRLSGGDWIAGSAIASYIGNLYILSPKNNQIYRHSKTSIGYSASSSYVKRTNTVSLANATSLAINGTIIVANNSKQLSVFTNGVGEETTIDSLPASAPGISQIQLSATDQLIALSKTGKSFYELSLTESGFSFQKQLSIQIPAVIQSYTAPQGNQLYLLSGKKVLSVTIP